MHAIDEALVRLRNLGGDTLVRKMIDAFADSAGEKIDACRDGLERGDLESIERAAHSLKSSAGNFGAERLVELARDTEQAAREGEVELLPALVAELPAAYAEVRDYLEGARRGDEEDRGR